MSDTYWPCLTGNELAAKIIDRFETFEFHLRHRDLDRMLLATYAYYGQNEDGFETHRISKVGQQEQARHLMDNEYRSVVQNKLTMVTAEPGGFLPVPANTDADTQATTMRAKGVLEYYFDAKKGDRVCIAATEEAENLAWAWVDVPWKDDAGPKVGADPMLGEAPPAPEGAPPDALAPPRPLVGMAEVLAGDVALESMLPTDVAFDYDARGELQWLILRKWLNKFDLAARVEARGPEAKVLADRIRDFHYTPKNDDISKQLRGWTNSERNISDEVPLYELRHVKTPACPKGRWARVLSADLVIDEGPERYFTPAGSDLACYRINAADRYGTPRAYTSAHDMLGLQRAVDTLGSIMYSNEAGLGLNVMVSYEGSEVRPEEIRRGLINLVVKGGPELKPDVLSLTNTPKEIGENRAQLKNDMGTKEGMDALSMGRDDRPLSGQAFVMLDTKTQRAVSGLRGAFNDLRRDVATGILRRFAQFGKHSRTLPLVAGKSKRLIFGGFSGKDFEGIDRVKVEDLSPMMRAMSGRTETLRMVLEAKAQGIAPESVITFVETGKWDGFNEAPMAEELTIREENERLLAGEVLDSEPPPVDPLTGTPLPPMPGAPPPVATAIFSDNPIKHMLGHKVVMSSPSGRRDPTIIRNYRLHQEAHARHLLRWMGVDPALIPPEAIQSFVMLALHGPPPQMPMPAGPPGAPPGAAGPDGGAPPPDGGGKGLPSGDGPKESGLPSPPTNPATGEQWSPTGEVNG